MYTTQMIMQMIMKIDKDLNIQFIQGQIIFHKLWLILWAQI